MNRPHKWDSGHPETVCGKGAKLSETIAIREWIPHLCERYDIKSIADVGCGDQNWMKHVTFRDHVHVAGFDYSPLATHVTRFDCTRDILTLHYDMIQCIYVLNHLYQEGDVDKAITNFYATGIPWLLATFSDLEPLPLPHPIEVMFHKEKNSGGVIRHWSYGLFKLC